MHHAHCAAGRIDHGAVSIARRGDRGGRRPTALGNVHFPTDGLKRRGLNLQAGLGRWRRILPSIRTAERTAGIRARSQA